MATLLKNTSGSLRLKIGYNGKLGGWVIPWPANLHTHLRWLPEMMQLVVPESAQLYWLVTAMPNLQADRILTVTQMISYTKKVLNIVESRDLDLQVMVPRYLEPETTVAMIKDAAEAQRICNSPIPYFSLAKLYPRGGTTNSAEGVDFRQLHELSPVFGAMAEHNQILLIHAEPQHTHDGADIDLFKREEASIPYIDTLLRAVPKLKVVIEHASSRSMIEAIRRWREEGYAVQMSVAPQYLAWNRNKLFEGGMNPAWYSIPVLKEEGDRLALIQAALSGLGFLGTDSAPHPVGSKTKACGCAGGVFNEPVSLGVYFDTFRAHGGEDWFEQFVDFACYRGPDFYGIPRDAHPEGGLLIKEQPWKVPNEYRNGDLAVIPMYAGQDVPYTIERL